MTLESMITLSIAIMLLTIKPGPGMIAIISRSLSDGFFPAFAIALGIITIQVFYFSLAAFSFAIAENELLFISILMKSLGATYLFYIGIKGFIHLERGLWGGKPDEQTKVTLLENYGAGLAITLANPFILLFYSGVIPTILNLDDLKIHDVIIGALVIAITNLSLLSIECALADRFRYYLKNLKVVKAINIGTSTAFIFIGLFLVFSLFPAFEFNLGFNF